MRARAPPFLRAERCVQLPAQSPDWPRASCVATSLVSLNGLLAVHQDGDVATHDARGQSGDCAGNCTHLSARRNGGARAHRGGRRLAKYFPREHFELGERISGELVVSAALLDLDGRVALVTGASSGIGRETCAGTGRGGRCAGAGRAARGELQRVDRKSRQRVVALQWSPPTWPIVLPCGRCVRAPALSSARPISSSMPRASISVARCSKSAMTIGTPCWQSTWQHHFSFASLGTRDDPKRVGPHHQHRFTAIGARVSDGCSVRCVERAVSRN